ncbi:Glucooligosaccharide oxidase [Annulohypoxylon truncatum]|uniref:Glucooligosaccharide oxidase n=1 Tax=Annulohypoxylon truncatum TaxID=327061 RepID=UPI002008D37C|nr:Glucooligosaccharide oxidase [Annulohypoxylon truncatum]KAI1208146.1 Glucooligosaccharide oxidase [Annulohypoxylon truncatum]
MKLYHYIIVVAISSYAIAEAVHKAHQRNIWNANDTSSLESLYHTLGLSDAETQDVRDRFTRATPADGNINVACVIAQCVMGEGIVDTSPLNQTVVDENWSLSCVAEPHCIIQPAEATDVSKSIQIINFFQVKFAIRSGGHSPNLGWSSVGNDGILLDLSKMNQISLSNDGKSVKVGAGARWGEVVAALDPHGTTVVAGRDPSVGVSGLILGGGYSHISPEFGLAADNVKNFEIVLANGTIANANADLNCDLFWALKGGGPNFGIVTHLVLFTLPVYEIWLQLALYSPNQSFDILDAFARWQSDPSIDPKSSVGLEIGLDSVLLGLVYSGPSDQPDAFAPFYGLTPLQVIVPPINTTFKYLNDILSNDTSKAPARHDYRAVSSRIDAQLYKDVYKFWREKALAVRNDIGANQTFVLQHVPKTLVEAGIAKGGNSLGLPQESHQWWTTIVDWEREEDDDLARSVSIETTHQWNKLGEERDLDLQFVYMNDASRDQNPISSYGAKNVGRLKQISQKYDEGQIFQTLQNGGFLLSHIM